MARQPTARRWIAASHAVTMTSVRCCSTSIMVSTADWYFSLRHVPGVVQKDCSAQHGPANRTVALHEPRLATLREGSGFPDISPWTGPPRHTHNAHTNRRRPHHLTLGFLSCANNDSHIPNHRLHARLILIETIKQSETLYFLLCHPCDRRMRPCRLRGLDFAAASLVLIETNPN